MATELYSVEQVLKRSVRKVYSFTVGGKTWTCREKSLTYCRDVYFQAVTWTYLCHMESPGLCWDAEILVGNQHFLHTKAACIGGTFHHVSAVHGLLKD